MTVRLPAMQALRAFEATARMQSLSKAAEALHVTHGAISHQIKALEEEIGVRLVERAGRGIRLTDEGERFAGRVRGALAELAEAMREVAERTNPRQLRVSVVPSFAARWLIPRIGRFFAAHPDIDLDVRANNAYVDFSRDDADVAIRYGLGSWPGVIAEHVLDEVHFPVCSPRFAQGRLPKRPEDLSRHTLLRSEGESWKPWFEAAELDWPEPTRGPMFSDTSHTMQAAVDGQGIALARSTLLGNDVHNGLLVRLFAVSVPGRYKYYLAYPPRLANSPKLDAFRQWVLAEIAAEPAVPARGTGRRRGPPAMPSARTRKA